MNFRSRPSNRFAWPRTPFRVLTEKVIDGTRPIRERTGIARSFSSTVAMRSRSELASGFLLVSAKPSGAHHLVWTDRDKHAGPAAAGRSRVSRWDLHLERLSRQCDVAIASCRGASVRQKPHREPTSLRESSNHISGTFAHEVLNIRYAIGDLDQEDRRTRQTSRVRCERLR